MIYFPKHNLNTFKVFFCGVIGCSIAIYNFILRKCSIEILYIPNTPNYRELLTVGVIFAINWSEYFIKN